jgi:hypothetical protein
MRFEDLFFDITVKFAKAWNLGDFDTMYQLMHEKIVYESPLVSHLMPEYPDNRIEGREALNEYFRKAIMRKPAIVLVPDSMKMNKQNRTIRIESEILSLNKKMDAFILLNEYGKLVHLKITYFDPGQTTSDQSWPY